LNDVVVYREKVLIQLLLIFWLLRYRNADDCGCIFCCCMLCSCYDFGCGFFYCCYYLLQL